MLLPVLLKVIGINDKYYGNDRIMKIPMTTFFCPRPLLCACPYSLDYFREGFCCVTVVICAAAEIDH